jgi:hypothetical protein
VSNRLYLYIRTLCCVFLLTCLSLFVIETWRWPLIGDAVLMHYIVFLMHHGMAPYRDIVDPNLPTTLWIEAAVMHLFGGGSLAWRLFDLFLLAITGIAMIVIARPYDWFAGFFAAALFALIHGRDGVMQLGQRDLTMTAFLVLAYAFLFEAMRALPPIATNTDAPRPDFRTWDLPGRTRSSQGLLMALFGLFCGAAATIKPTMLLLPAALLIMAAITLRQRRQPFRSPILAGAVGALIPPLLSFAWVWHKDVTAAFLATLFDLIPYFAHLGTRSFGHLLLHSVSSVLLPLVILWLAILILQKKQLTWERAALLAGVLFGLASFYLQRKGYSYHRYPSEAFLLLLAAIDLTAVFQQKPSTHRLLLQRLALAGILIGTLVMAGGSTAHALRQDWRNHEFDTMLQSDLNRLGGQQLAGHIQCLDMGDGCIPTLYNMRLVQATGFLYDCYMFSPVQAAERERYREAFWQVITRKPPAVFVITSNDCENYPEKPSYNYQKTSRWPLFDTYLKTNYHLDVERIPPHMVNTGSSPSKPLGYRIYVRN